MVVEERRKGWRGTAGAEKPNARRSVSTRATVREGGICRREGRRRVEGRLTLCPFPPTIRLVAALLLHRSAATSDTPEMVNPPTSPPPSLLLPSFFLLFDCITSDPSIGSSFLFLISHKLSLSSTIRVSFIIRLRDPRATDLERTISFRLVSGYVTEIRRIYSINPSFSFFHSPRLL